VKRLVDIEAEAKRTGDDREVVAAYRGWIRTEPENPVPKFNLSLLLLARGEYEEGWRLYESRTEIAGHKPRPKLAIPEWQGQPVRSLLVLFEQGFGDQIMFARYLPELAGRGIAASFLSPPHLARLFAPLGVRVIPAEGRVEVKGYDAWVLIGSLPRLVGGMPPAGYLPGATAGKGIGVVTRGNIVPDASRSLDEANAERLLALPGAVSLMPEDTGAKDFEDTAQMMRGLERIITIDTAAAHLAGAMGMPTTVLLIHQGDWRWGRGERTAWYPTATILRQPQPGDWTSVVDQAIASAT
jgi:hypothetical protein